jgi:hypothetical protein
MLETTEAGPVGREEKSEVQVLTSVLEAVAAMAIVMKRDAEREKPSRRARREEER